METNPVFNITLKILIVIFAIFAAFIYKSLNDLENNHLRNKYELEVLTSSNKIDSLIKESKYLNTKIDSLNEIKLKKDSVIITIIKSYEKDFITINNQSISKDVLFFTKYLSEDDRRFIINNNSAATKTY